jgi:hypothetical protein
MYVADDERSWSYTEWGRFCTSRQRIVASEDGGEKRVGKVSLCGIMFYIMDGRSTGEYPTHVCDMYFSGIQRFG